jgi:hypothetical protein
MRKLKIKSFLLVFGIFSACHYAFAMNAHNSIRSRFAPTPTPIGIIEENSQQLKATQRYSRLLFLLPSEVFERICVQTSYDDMLNLKICCIYLEFFMCRLINPRSDIEFADRFFRELRLVPADDLPQAVINKLDSTAELEAKIIVKYYKKYLINLQVITCGRDFYGKYYNNTEADIIKNHYIFSKICRAKNNETLSTEFEKAKKHIIEASIPSCAAAPMALMMLPLSSLLGCSTGGAVGKFMVGKEVGGCASSFGCLSVTGLVTLYCYFMEKTGIPMNFRAKDARNLAADLGQESLDGSEEYYEY